MFYKFLQINIGICRYAFNMLLDQVVSRRRLPGPHKLRQFLRKTVPSF